MNDLCFYTYFLGFGISMTREGHFVNQREYIEDSYVGSGRVGERLEGYCIVVQLNANW